MAEPDKVPAKLVLVTGAPRSGTTAVGELLSSSQGAIELYEPMSEIVGDKVVSSWLPVVGQVDFGKNAVDSLVDRIRRRRVRNGFRPQAIQGNLGRSRWFNRSRRTAILARLQPWKRTQVWKDPMALFVAFRVARTTEIPVIITVRDPLSLASSFKRMSWRPPVEDLVARMKTAGMAIDPRIDALIEGELDAAKAGAIAWNLSYSTLLAEMRAGFAGTVIVNSDLMATPSKVQKRLVSVTGLQVPEPRAVVAHDPSNSTGALPERAHIQTRSLESITQYWKKTLDEDQVEFCRALNDELWTELTAEIDRHQASW